MCGIFFYAGPHRSTDELHEEFMRLQHRGPDASQFHVVYATNGLMLAFGFHRLAINGGLSRIEAEQLEAKPGDATQAVEAGFCFGTVRIEHAHAEIMAGIVARGEQ